MVTATLKVEIRQLRRALDQREDEVRRLRGEREERRAAVEAHKARLSRLAEQEREAAERARRELAAAATDTGRRLGVAEGAEVDYIRRVIEAGFTARDGVVIAPRGVERLATWTLALRATAPHLFTPSSGSPPINTSYGPPPRWISGADPLVFGSYLEEIARGRMKVSR